MGSAFAPVGLALIALLASLARWALQGSRNLYTALEKQFYVPDPDVGWTVSDQHAIWLGLEVIGAVAAVMVGLGVGGWIIQRLERKRGGRLTVLRGLAWLVAVVALAVPIGAFATGFGPEGGKDTRPRAELASAPTASGAAPGPAGAGRADGADARGVAGAGVGSAGAGVGSAAPPVPEGPAIAGSLALPIGTYAVVKHKNNAISAQLDAGGERFEARFADGLKGSWAGDPADFTKPSTAEISADAAGVDTGIGARSKHAREGFLHADQHPRIGWKLEKLLTVRQDGPDKIAFRATGTVSLMGQDTAVDVTGTLKKADAAALGRLKLTGSVMIAEADFALIIKETALAKDASTFEGDRFPIHVSLVLRHTADK